MAGAFRRMRSIRAPGGARRRGAEAGEVGPMHRRHVATWAQRVVHLGAMLLVACLLVPATAARADRFGLPSQGRVTADTAIVYSEPDPHSPVVGPLGKESHLALLGQSRDADGGLWT